MIAGLMLIGLSSLSSVPDASANSSAFGSDLNARPTATPIALPIDGHTVVSNGRLEANLIKTDKGRGMFAGSSGYYNFRGDSGTRYYFINPRDSYYPVDDNASVQFCAKAKSGTVNVTLFLKDKNGKWYNAGGNHTFTTRESCINKMFTSRAEVDGVDRIFIRFNNSGQLRVKHWEVTFHGPYWWE